MPESGYPYVGWTRNDTPEREETSFNFSYKLNNNWSLAFGAYNGSTDVDYTEAEEIQLFIRIQMEHFILAISGI